MSTYYECRFKDLVLKGTSKNFKEVVKLMEFVNGKTSEELMKIKRVNYPKWTNKNYKQLRLMNHFNDDIYLRYERVEEGIKINICLGIKNYFDIEETVKLFLRYYVSGDIFFYNENSLVKIDIKKALTILDSSDIEDSVLEGETVWTDMSDDCWGDSKILHDGLWTSEEAREQYYL